MDVAPTAAPRAGGTVAAGAAPTWASTPSRRRSWSGSRRSSRGGWSGRSALEQLRALEHGLPGIRVVDTTLRGFGSTRRQDLERARALSGRAGRGTKGEGNGERGKKTKYIFVTGGVVSSLGKGLAAASIGALLENRGLEVTHLKLDPYINVDPGTMSPFQHGEVYVTDDGAETDLDLGPLRALHQRQDDPARTTSPPAASTTSVIQQGAARRVPGQDRPGDSRTSPTRSRRSSARPPSGADIVIVEIGGTVGDIESLPFLEAIRQMKYDVGQRERRSTSTSRCVPYIAAAGELKTKPTQHSVKELREIGIQPDILLCRTDREISREMKDKIALFCNVDPGGGLHRPDVPSIYEVPLALHREGLDDKLAELLNIWSRAPRLERWETHRREGRPARGQGEVRIGVVGKYVELRESYKSLNEALVHGGIANDVQGEARVRRRARSWRRATVAALDERGRASWSRAASACAAPRARSWRCATPARRRSRSSASASGCRWRSSSSRRNVLGPGAAPTRSSSTRHTPHPVVTLMEAQRGVADKGGTMRLGSLRLRARGGHDGARALRRQDLIQRAPPPPLRVQQRLPRRSFEAAGHGLLRASTRSSGWWR